MRSELPDGGRGRGFVVPVLLAVTGSLLIAIPRKLFPSCGFSPLLAGVPTGTMPCDTSGGIVMALGGVTLASAAASLIGGRYRTGGLLAAALAAFAAFPVLLGWPGTCPSGAMPCRIGTLPAVLLAAALQYLTAVAALLGAMRGEKR